MPGPGRIRSSKHIIREPAERNKPAGAQSFFGRPWKEAFKKEEAVKRKIPRKPEDARKLAVECVFAALKELGAAKTAAIPREDWIAFTERKTQSPAMREFLQKLESRKKARLILGEQDYERQFKRLWNFAKSQKTAGLKKCVTIIGLSDQIIQRLRR